MLRELQEDDPDFQDIVVSLKCLADAEMTVRNGATSDQLYHTIKKALVGKGALPRNAARRAERGMLSMGDYTLDGLLYRR
eukprot:10010086-Lingulodinium_polyedra.AAC.1